MKLTFASVVVLAGVCVVEKKNKRLRSASNLGLYRRLAMLVSAIGLFAIGPHNAAIADGITITTDDLWDVNQGSVVTGNSPVIVGNPIERMFGADDGYTNAFFQDSQPQGTVHWVEWQTPSPMTLRSFTLLAAHDAPPPDPNRRGFSRFTLYAYNSGTSAYDNELFEIFPADPYGDTPSPANALIETYGFNNFLLLSANVTPTTTDRFRAEFVQWGTASGASGPRITELDGFDTYSSHVVPEPTSLAALFGMGVMGLTGWRRCRNKSR